MNNESQKGTSDYERLTSLVCSSNNGMSQFKIIIIPLLTLLPNHVENFLNHDKQFGSVFQLTYGDLVCIGLKRGRVYMGTFVRRYCKMDESFMNRSKIWKQTCSREVLGNREYAWHKTKYILYDSGITREMMQLELCEYLLNRFWWLLCHWFGLYFWNSDAKM